MVCQNNKVEDEEMCILQKKIKDEEKKDEEEEEGMGLAMFLGSVFAFVYSVAMLIMGSLYFSECELQPLLPIYLFVAGVDVHCGFIAYFISRWKKLKDIRKVLLPFVLFFVLWFIFGSIVVFSKVKDWHSPYRCNVDLFNFARGSLVFFWGTTLTSILIWFCRRYIFD
ncbi:transmembrane protein 272-like [Hydractinia symbiolongicarpus]|uniref:transmembrane protein 272-like n=1 Tax=Hydractinia symbiolongicarpus TaxID=13093 RepID=UPI00255082B1|nr:transmembrane protein 272-like [Hydractinia symbiolongicarpus]